MTIYIVYFGSNEVRVTRSMLEAQEYARLFISGPYRIEGQRAYETVLPAL